MRALYFEQFGDPSVLLYGDVQNPAPAPGSVLVRTRAIGLNFADVYRRRGNYHLVGSPPYILGYEAAGVVEEVNADDTELPGWLRPGARVGFADSPHANAELVAVPIEKLLPLPDDISFETAAASLLQGLTAHYLVRDSHRIVAGERAIVHAAAGGVGLLLVQMLKTLGAHVTGLVSRDEKRSIARDAGADDVLLYSDAWSPSEADVVYDSLGATLKQSLAAVRRGGHVVFFGFAGGDPPPIDPRELMDGSKSLTGGDLWNVLTGAHERRQRAAELFAWIRDGNVRVRIDSRFALYEGASAHERLESRQSAGKILLIP